MKNLADHVQFQGIYVIQFMNPTGHPNACGVWFGGVEGVIYQLSVLGKPNPHFWWGKCLWVAYPVCLVDEHIWF